MTQDMKKVLIVDDDVAVTNYFMVFLMQTELFEPEVENDSRQVADLLRNNQYDVIMLDLDMPNVTGMEILRMMKAEGHQIPVVILTGASDVDLAVRSMKHGAFDYLTKPVEDEHLLEVLNNAMEMGAMKQSMDDLPDNISGKDLEHEAAFAHLPTQDENMLRLFHQAETLADGNLNVFLWGERGTGKKWLANAIHKASGRWEQPFVALDCTTIAPDEFSGELFGKAPIWGEDSTESEGAMFKACGGTLFLNNIEHMSPPTQLRLNHALQTGEYYRDNSTEIRQCDTRYIMASTHDLTSSRFQESFSRDLLYHVMINSLQLPALRERAADIPLLVNYFIEDENRRSNKTITRVTPGFLELLEPYYFPGNIQELRKLVIAAVALTDDDELGIDDISAYSRERLTLGSFGSTFHPQPLQEVIRHQVQATVKYCKGDLKEAARQLDISPKVLDSYLAEE